MLKQDLKNNLDKILESFEENSEINLKDFKEKISKFVSANSEANYKKVLMKNSKTSEIIARQDLIIKLIKSNLTLKQISEIIDDRYQICYQVKAKFNLNVISEKDLKINKKLRIENLKFFQEILEENYQRIN